MDNGAPDHPLRAAGPADFEKGSADERLVASRFRRRKALRGWRKFGIEIGTIVLGILIALALDQWASAISNASNAAEAREVVRDEVTTNITRVGERGKVQDCVDRRLDELQRLLKGVAVDGRIQRPGWIGRPPRYGIETQRWDVASQSGRTSLFEADEQGRYGFLYTVLAYFYEMENGEQLAWSKLSALEGLDRLTDDGRLAMLTALGEARFYNASIRQITPMVLERAKQLEIMPRPRTDTPATVCWPMNLSDDEVQARLKADAGAL